jgi:riboflavin synthase
VFTGIIEEIGAIRTLQRRSGYQRTTVDAQRVLDDIRIGDSITIDGACQTVVEFDPKGFTVESVEETLRRSTLGALRPGRRVNLERALKLGDRLGGHMVAGHVDGVGRMLRRRDGANGVEFQVGMPAELSPYVAEKGSIAIDGISLTVTGATAREFGVAVIPHTLESTTLSERRPGDPVNLEVDTVARYIQRLMTTPNPG